MQTFAECSDCKKSRSLSERNFAVENIYSSSMAFLCSAYPCGQACGQNIRDSSLHLKFVAVVLTARDRFAYAPIWAENYTLRSKLICVIYRGLGKGDAISYAVI
jgi:hypothetical protein